MEHVEAAYQAGVAEAERDIATGNPRLRYGARAEWGKDLARTLQARFGVELVFLTCFSSSEQNSFDAGYNDTIEAHIDSIYGKGALAAVWAEVQLRRQQAYDKWLASKPQAGPSTET